MSLERSLDNKPLPRPLPHMRQISNHCTTYKLLSYAKWLRQPSDYKHGGGVIIRLHKTAPVIQQVSRFLHRVVASWGRLDPLFYLFVIIFLLVTGGGRRITYNVI